MEEKMDSSENIKDATQESKVVSKCHLDHSGAKVAVAIILLVIILGAAAVIGKAAFWRQNRLSRAGVAEQSYTMGPRGGGMMRGEDLDRRGGHFYRSEISGKISKIDGNNITITGYNRDLVIVISDTTSIYDDSGNIVSKDSLKADSQIRVFGKPNSSGQIPADVIYIQ